jgi:hypothetical protein
MTAALSTVGELFLSDSISTQIYFDNRIPIGIREKNSNKNFGKLRKIWKILITSFTSIH